MANDPVKLIKIPVTMNHEEVTNGLQNILSGVNAPNVVRAKVTVTLLTDGGDLSHIEYNIDHESEQCNRLGHIVSDDFEGSNERFEFFSQHNSVTWSDYDANGVGVLSLGDPENSIGYIFDK